MAVALAAGCQVLPDKGLSGPASDVVVAGFNSPPRLRLGATPSVRLGAPFIGADLGTHGYYFRLSEKNGIAYTHRGGHIDTMHVRIAADWAAYLAARSYRHLMRGDPSFSYKLLADRSRHTVHLTYPANWQSLPEEQRHRTAREAALTMGPYLAFTMVSWHEILTWYGFRSVGVIQESHSAFSWEDSYSNLLGAVIAAQALRDTQHSYDQAVSMTLDQEMRVLGVQPASVAKQASKSVQGKWYVAHPVGYLAVMRRNCDIGADDGYVTPVLVPGLPAVAAEPLSYPAPTLDGLSQYGIQVSVDIEPHEWERGRILRIVYPDGRGRRIYPAAHFAAIIARVHQEITEKYGAGMADGPLPATTQSQVARSRPVPPQTTKQTVRHR
jgi:hypothetical protein